jgi:hypothetical protein
VERGLRRIGAATGRRVSQRLLFLVMRCGASLLDAAQLRGYNQRFGPRTNDEKTEIEANPNLEDKL